MAVFGLPPVAHENDPARAVLAALELREKLVHESNQQRLGYLQGLCLWVLLGAEVYVENMVFWGIK